MADISLHIGGDSHEAQEALHGAGTSAHEAHDQFHELKEKLGELKESFAAGTIAANAFEKGIETLKEGLKESWEEAAKAENAERQLAAAAGELTSEFKEQAEAIGANLAMKAEDIEHMQTLLLRYGAAPDVIGKAVVALQNYAAATGQDANNAMMMFIRGVESGHGSLGRMGVQFEATGDKTHDFAAAVEALNAKFGGAADIEASGMSGRARAASNALDEMKKSFGELMGLVENKLGILEKTSDVFRDIASSISAGTKGDFSGAFGKAASSGLGSVTGLGGIFNAYSSLTGDADAKPGGGKGAVPTVEGENKFAGGGVDLEMGQLELSPTKKALDAAAKNEDEYLHQYNKWQDAMWTAARKTEADELKAEQKHDDEMMKLKVEAADSEMKLKEDAAHAWLEQQKKLDDLEFEELKQQTRRQEEELKKREHSWVSMGERIGQALIDGLSNAMKPGGAAGGGKQDPWLIFGQTLIGIFSAVMPLWGSLVGVLQKQGASGGWFDISGGGGVGGAATSWWGGGAKPHDGMSDWTNYGASNPNEWENPYDGGGFSAPPLPSSHAGSWPRFHRGGWPGLYEDEKAIITQRGERVLSRSEVSNMGGPSSVDAAARGGGTQVMNVYAWDSQNIMETFGGRLGRGMLNTVRTGKGPLREMFGGS